MDSNSKDVFLYVTSPKIVPEPPVGTYRQVNAREWRLIN